VNVENLYVSQANLVLAGRQPLLLDGGAMLMGVVGRRRRASAKAPQLA